MIWKRDHSWVYVMYNIYKEKTVYANYPTSLGLLMVTKCCGFAKCCKPRCDFASNGGYCICVTNTASWISATQIETSLHWQFWETNLQRHGFLNFWPSRWLSKGITTLFDQASKICEDQQKTLKQRIHSGFHWDDYCPVILGRGDVGCFLKISQAKSVNPEAHMHCGSATQWSSDTKNSAGPDGIPY